MSDFFGLDLGDIVSGGLGWWGQQRTKDAALDAARIHADTVNRNADAAMAASMPWAVGGTGGFADFDPESRVGVMELSPELQDIYSGALGRSGLWGAQAAQFMGDPFGAADKFYQMQQELIAPEEQKLRLAAEDRLRAQGRLGTTGGMNQYGELEKQIQQGQNERRVSSFNQAQAYIDSLLGRESGDIGTATGLLNIPLQYGKLGRGIGGDLSGIAQAQLGARNKAADIWGKPSAIDPWGKTLSAMSGLFSQPIGSSGKTSTALFGR